MVDDVWAQRLREYHEVLRNRIAQSGVQVVKDYVELWRLTHAGALPTGEQLAWDGAVGSSHAWWPKDPWSGAPMTAGPDKGQFQYVPSGDVYALTVRETPLTDPRYLGEFPEYCAARGPPTPPTSTAQQAARRRGPHGARRVCTTAAVAAPRPVARRCRATA